MGGSRQVLTFDSSPSGATVRVDGIVVGQTPYSGEIKRKHKSVTFQKEGFVSQTIPLETKFNAWFLGNILLFGFIGSSVDSSTTGAINEYEPGSFYVTLEPAVRDTSDFFAPVSSDKNQVQRASVAGQVDNPRNAVRNFVLANFQNLRREVFGNDGEYVRSLNSVLLRAGRPEPAKPTLQSIFTTCAEPVACAEYLAGDRPLVQTAQQQPTPAPSAVLALRKPSKMVVVPLRPVGSVTKELCQLLTSLLLSKFSAVSGLTTIGDADIQAMVGVERQKDMMGCTDTACIAEIGGALGSDLVLHGEVGMLGKSYNLNFSVVSSATSSVVTRTSRIVSSQSEEALDGELSAMVRDIVNALNSSQ